MSRTYINQSTSNLYCLNLGTPLSRLVKCHYECIEYYKLHIKYYTSWLYHMPPSFIILNPSYLILKWRPWSGLISSWYAHTSLYAHPLEHSSPHTPPSGFTFFPAFLVDYPFKRIGLDIYKTWPSRRTFKRGFSSWPAILLLHLSGPTDHQDL